MKSLGGVFSFVKHQTAYVSQNSDSRIPENNNASYNNATVLFFLYKGTLLRHSAVIFLDDEFAHYPGGSHIEITRS